MDYSAFKNPDGTLAIIFASSNGVEQNFTVTDGYQYVDVSVPSNSVVSVLFGNIENSTVDIEENGTYDLIQNKSYSFSTKEPIGAVDPDCFFENLDESGSYRFMGVDGKYTIETDHGMLTSKASEASVFVSGSPNTFYKAGLYESTGWPVPKALTQVAPGIYRMTLKAGSNINPTNLNFKFFSSENWGDLTFNTLKGMAADKLVVSDGNDGYDKGNIHYKDGASLTEGATYIVTINTADMSLDMQMQYDITDITSLETAINANGEYFKIKGEVSNDVLDKFVAYKNDGGKIRSLDFSEANLTKVPDSFMSKGNETVDGNLSKDKRNEYLEKVLLPNGLVEIGYYAFSSCPNLRVLNITRDIESLGTGVLMYDYRLHALSFDNKKEKTNAMTIPLAFMQMYNNRAPYEEEYQASCKEGLKDFYIGDNWTIDSIGRLSFFQNQNLASFKYSDKGTTIGAIRTNAFTNAYSLPATDINNLIKNSTEIWNAAFYSCHQLDKLTIPASLKFIDNAAFGDCPITDVYLTNSTSPAVPLYDATWYPYSWNYFSEYAFAGIRNKTNGTDQHVRLNQVTLHFNDGVSVKEYRYKTTEANDDSRVNELGDDDEAKGKPKYGEFLRLLTKSIYQDRAYDIKGQEHADLRIYRTFKSNWNTICLPISLTEAQIKKAFGENTVIAEFVNVVKADVDDGNVLQFKTTHAGIEAGKPYIMMVQDSYGNNVSLTPPFTEKMYNNYFEDEYVSDKTNGYYLIEDISLPSSDKLPALQQVQHDKYTFIGNYSPLNISQENNVLYISNNEFRYKDAGSTTNSGGYRAYFIVDKSLKGSGLSKSMNFSFDETTGIVSVSLKKNSVSEPIYDLSGRKVVATLENLSSGIYIIGGKKIVIK